MAAMLTVCRFNFALLSDNYREVHQTCATEEATP